MPQLLAQPSDFVAWILAILFVVGGGIAMLLAAFWVLIQLTQLGHDIKTKAPGATRQISKAVKTLKDEWRKGQE